MRTPTWRTGVVAAVLIGAGAPSVNTQSPPLARVLWGGNTCSGTRFGGNLVLTVAHCVPPVGNIVTVTVGSSEQKREVIARDEPLRLAVVCAPESGEGRTIATATPDKGDEVYISIDRKLRRSVVLDSSAATVGVDPIGKKPCGGDSGGPLIHDGRIAGVLEYAGKGHDQSCGKYARYYSTTSAAAATFLDGAVSAAKSRCQE